MKWYLAPLPLLALFACATPQQQCVAQVSHDLNVLNRLIAETQGNIDRGYGYRTTVETRPQFTDCSFYADPFGPAPRSNMCFQDVPTTVRRPVAVNLANEQAKLDTMIKRRNEMEAPVARQIAACQAQYPQ